MVTISQVVKEILDSRIFLQEAISRNIVSYNLLAIHLKPEIEAEIGKTVKTSAIVMALRRQTERIEQTIKKPTFSYSIETIKTNICYIVLEESSTLLNNLQNLYSIIDFKKGGILNIIQGNYEVAIITNHKYKNKLLEILCDEKVLDTLDNLVSISLTYSKKFLFTPGALYDVLRFITWQNINMIDIILTSTEMSLIIDKKDLMKCYNVLGKFIEISKKTN